MTPRVLAALTALAFVPTLAHADDAEPCADSVTDPVITPLRDRLLDLQRGACLRDEISAGILAHALVDTPGFHGVLGGTFALGTRVVIAGAYELSAQLALVDYTFVQTAVNKATHAGIGPLVLGAATGGRIGNGARAALALRVEVPSEIDAMDTLHTGAQLSGVVSGTLARRLTLHGRLGTVAAYATSPGGSTRRLGLVAGADLAWHVRPRLALQAGADVMGGWDAAVDHVLARAGLNWRMRDAWRLRFGVGLPVAGDDRTNVVAELGVVVDH